MSDSLQPHESQHTRPPCPSPTPRAYPNPCPSSWWCHPTISFSVVPFSSCPQSFSASGSFPMSQFFAWGGQSIGVSASTSVLPVNTTLVWTAWVHLYMEFFVCLFYKHSAYFFILKIFQLTKCGEIFVFNWRSEIVESKELGYEFWFCPNCFSFLPLCESFNSSFVSEAEIAVPEFFHCDVEGGRESYP